LSLGQAELWCAVGQRVFGFSPDFAELLPPAVRDYISGGNQACRVSGLIGTEICSCVINQAPLNRRQQLTLTLRQGWSLAA
jgi:hypothetical protein